MIQMTEDEKVYLYLIISYICMFPVFIYDVFNGIKNNEMNGNAKHVTLFYFALFLMSPVRFIIFPGILLFLFFVSISKLFYWSKNDES